MIMQQFLFQVPACVLTGGKGVPGNPRRWCAGGEEAGKPTYVVNYN